MFRLSLPDACTWAVKRALRATTCQGEATAGNRCSARRMSAGTTEPVIQSTGGAALCRCRDADLGKALGIAMRCTQWRQLCKLISCLALSTGLRCGAIRATLTNRH